MQPGRARRQGDGVGAPGRRGELLLEGAVLVVGVLEPGVAGGVGDGLDLAVGDPRPGDRDPLAGVSHGARSAAPAR